MSLPYFNLYPSDFEADTSHLTLEEDGAYNRLLRLSWMMPGCSLPDDPAWIARRMRVDMATFERVVAPILSEFFKRGNGRIWSPRLLVEWKKADVTYRARSEAGKKGGRPKAVENKTKEKKPGFGFDKAGPKQPEPEPEPEPDKKNPPPSVSTTSKKTAAEEEFLDQILRAVGHDPNGDLPEFWVDESAGLFIADWRGLGLADAEIIATAKATRQGNPAPPNGPKALDKAMRAAAKPKASQASIDAGLASAIAERKTYLLAHVTRSRAEELVSAGLVTVDQCQAAGVL